MAFVCCHFALCWTNALLWFGFFFFYFHCFLGVINTFTLEFGTLTANIIANLLTLSRYSRARTTFSGHLRFTFRISRGFMCQLKSKPTGKPFISVLNRRLLSNNGNDSHLPQALLICAIYLTVVAFFAVIFLAWKSYNKTTDLVL